MADIAKVITVIGNSPDGFAEAAQVAVSEASKTLRGIHGAHVLSMSCDVTDDKITSFKTTVNIAFAVER
jgi:flavin-binding protein dodecin